MKIESGVSRPPVKSGRKIKYPLKDLEPGQSLYIPMKDNSPSSKEYDNLQSLMYYYGSTYNRTYSLRSEGKGVRVWRMK